MSKRWRPPNISVVDRRFPPRFSEEAWREAYPGAPIPADEDSGSGFFSPVGDRSVPTAVSAYLGSSPTSKCGDLLVPLDPGDRHLFDRMGELPADVIRLARDYLRNLYDSYRMYGQHGMPEQWGFVRGQMQWWDAGQRAEAAYVLTALAVAARCTREGSSEREGWRRIVDMHATLGGTLGADRSLYEEATRAAGAERIQPPKPMARLLVNLGNVLRGFSHKSLYRRM